MAKKAKPSIRGAEKSVETKVTKKSGKPTIEGAKEPQKVVKKEKKRVEITPPPEAITFIGNTMNPLLEDNRGKRSMCVALARETDNDDVLIEAVRLSGVCQKSGMGRESISTGELSKNEHSGRGYAIRCGRKLQKDYPDDKVAPFKQFAKELVALVVSKKVDSVREAAAAKYAEWRKTEPTKKAKKDKKAGKPTLEKAVKEQKEQADAAPAKKGKKKVKRDKPTL